MHYWMPPAARSTLLTAIGMMLVVGAVSQAGQQAAGQARPGQVGQAPPPTRDTSALGQQQTAAVEASGRIAGRVVTADTGRPVRGARVALSAPQLSGGRNLVTDASGLFDFTGLPEGRYNLNVSKTGFVTLAYGQRRPLQPGTPLQ